MTKCDHRRHYNLMDCPNICKDDHVRYPSVCQISWTSLQTFLFYACATSSTTCLLSYFFVLFWGKRYLRSLQTRRLHAYNTLIRAFSCNNEFFEGKTVLNIGSLFREKIVIFGTVFDGTKFSTKTALQWRSVSASASASASAKCSKPSKQHLPDALNSTFESFPQILLSNILLKIVFRCWSASVCLLGRSRWTSTMSCLGLTPITSPVIQSRTRDSFMLLTSNSSVGADGLERSVLLLFDSNGYSRKVAVIITNRQYNISREAMSLQFHVFCCIACLTEHNTYNVIGNLTNTSLKLTWARRCAASEYPILVTICIYIFRPFKVTQDHRLSHNSKSDIMTS